MSFEGLEPLTEEAPALVKPRPSREVGERDRKPVFSAEQFGEKIRVEKVLEKEKVSAEVPEKADQVLEIDRDYRRAIGQQTPQHGTVSTNTNLEHLLTLKYLKFIYLF